jgi:hypothetical protein
VFFRLLRSGSIAALAACIAVCCTVAPPAAAQATTSISGTVTTSGTPAPNVVVTLSGNNVTLHATSDAAGRFRFPSLPIGAYDVSVASPSGRVSTHIELGSSGAVISLDNAALRKIGNTSVTGAPTQRASGTDTVINSQQLARSPSANSIPDLLVQLPTAARGSNGQVHINGDHNGLDYVVDGIQIPEGLNRVLGNEVDPSTIGFAEVLEGAYPAQYGDRFAAVVNISTKAKAGPPGASLDLRGGSYNLFDTVVGVHTPVGADGSLYVGARFFQDGRALDPPGEGFVHDTGSTTSQFLRYAQPLRGSDVVTLDVSHSFSTFQIPPDVSSGTPASTDDNETQDDTFASLIYRHAIGQNGVLSFGPSYKRSSILDTNDPANDLIGQVDGPDAAACSDFSTCAFDSVYADRTDVNVRFNLDYDRKFGVHEIHLGALYGAETLQKDYAITVGATDPSGTILMPYTVNDTAPNLEHQQEFFAQDSWEMGTLWRLDYGLRADAFQVSSTDFDNGFSQFSPRVKLTRNIGKRASIYGYYGRLFVPFSLESISPAASAALFGASAAPGTTNDLKPQRDSLYELGGHAPIGRAGDLGVRISHKVSTDWLDDTQVGATNLHQDINFPRGLVDSQNLYFQQRLANSSRFYVSVSHSNALNSLNCETQLLQNCAQFGPPGGDLVQADHDQKYDASSGLTINDRHNGWFSIDGEYGSGLSLGEVTLCPPYPLGNGVNCKVPPHITFDVVKGIGVGKHGQLALAIRNIFNDDYAITLDSALQGTHYARPRTFELRYSIAAGAGNGE